MWNIEGAELAADAARQYTLSALVERTRSVKLAARLRLRSGGCTHLHFLNSIISFGFDASLGLRYPD
jgi:hypothetical protein